MTEVKKSGLRNYNKKKWLKNLKYNDKNKGVKEHYGSKKGVKESWQKQNNGLMNQDGSKKQALENQDRSKKGA